MRIFSALQVLYRLLKFPAVDTMTKALTLRRKRCDTQYNTWLGKYITPTKTIKNN